MSDGVVKKKIGFKEKFTRFFLDARGEMKKIVWPGKKNVINNTGIVIVVMIIAAIFVGCLDVVTSQLIKFFVSII